MHFTWPTLLMIAASVQFLVIASYSVFSRVPLPKKGFRRADRVLAVSVLAVLGAGAANVNYAALWHRNTPAKQASVTMSQGSCALIDVGMPEAEVTRRLGAPDERAADEEARGPGAAVLLYKGPRCAVHLFEGRVESVD